MRLRLPHCWVCAALLLIAAPLRAQTAAPASPCLAEIDARIAELDQVIADLPGSRMPAQTGARLRRVREWLVSYRERGQCPEAEGDWAATDWSTTAMEHRGQVGSTFVYQCPPLAEGAEYGSAWGTDVYTDDSSVCVAAVHAGVITLARGGRIVVEMAPGRESYVGTFRNGITSAAYPAWESSFVVRGG
jgi:hypothetical protein